MKLRQPGHILVFFVLLTLHCNTTEPQYDLITPGSRNYEWTLDTLKLKDNDFLFLTRMWANTPNDVWAIGSGDACRNSIWHFDGGAWRTDSVCRAITPTGIFGFSSYDVWIGTAEGALWHFNGSSWRETVKLSLVDYNRIYIENIWGIAPNNIYAVGFAENTSTNDYKAILLNFNGTKWEFVQIPTFKLNFRNIRLQKSTGLYIINAYHFLEPNNGDKLLTYNGKDFTEVYTGNSSVEIFDMNGEVYITTDRKIYKCTDNQLTLWRDLSSNFFGYSVWGKNEKDFFGIALDWITNKDGVGHYNGTDFKKLLETSLHFTGAGAYTNNNVFMTAFDDPSNSSVIIHGKLKE